MALARQHSGRRDQLLQLAGLSLFLATVELMIPKPMPFLKLGIANLPILLFVRQLRYRELLLLVFLKVLCQSLITGSLLSYIVVFSASASLLSSSVMWLAARLPARYISLLGISILGAASSNGVQLLLALSYFFPGTGSLLIPWSLSFGLSSGVLLGLFALQFGRRSRWYSMLRAFFGDPAQQEAPERGPQPSAASVGPRAPLRDRALRHFAFGLLSLALMFALNELEPLYLGLELLLFLVLNGRIGHRPWWRSMLLLFFTLVFFHLLLPSGALLWELNWQGKIPLRVTQGALTRGVGKAFLLLCLIQISRFAVSRELRLPGRLGHVVQLVFQTYEGFLNCPLKFNGLRPFASLDAMLCLLNERPPAAAERPPRAALNCRWLALGLLLQAALLLPGYYLPLYQLSQWISGAEF